LEPSARFLMAFDKSRERSLDRDGKGCTVLVDT
jgi:hypothetical protein